jgi:hypothetical protein
MHEESSVRGYMWWLTEGPSKSGCNPQSVFCSGDFFLAEAEHLSSRSRKALALLNTLSSLDHPEALPGASGCPDINSLEVQHVTRHDPLVFPITSLPNRY